MAVSSRLPRPGKFFREPLSASVLRGLDDNEKQSAIAQARILAVAQLRESLLMCRKFFRGFESRDGYPLTERKLVRLSASKLRKIKKYAATVSAATSRPYTVFTPRSERQTKAAKLRAGVLGKNQRRYIIHHPDGVDAQVKFVKCRPADKVDRDIYGREEREGEDIEDDGEYDDGEYDEKCTDDFDTLEIVTKVKGGEIFERIYYLPRRPKSWDDVRDMTEQLQRVGMPTGNYKLYNSVYGPIGDLVVRSKLQESLDSFYSTYSTYLLGTILGWIWIGTTLDEAEQRTTEQKTVAERFQDARKRNATRERAKILRRGIK